MKFNILAILLILSIFSVYSQKNSIKNIQEIKIDKVYDSEGVIYNFTSETTKYEYNLKGKIRKEIRKINYDNQPYKTIITNYYQNKSNVTYKESSFIIEDSTSYKTFYTFENENLIQKKATYYVDSKKVDYLQNYYYKKNKIKKSTYTYLEQEVDLNYPTRNLVAEFYYNKKGKTIESNWLKSDSTYKYNRILHKRNGKGNIVSEKEYNKNGKLVTKTKYTYKLDSHKNWIEKNTFKNKILVQTTYRKITYYNK